MFQKIKELMTIQEELSNVSVKFDEHSGLIRTFNGAISVLREEIDLLKNSQNELVFKFNKDTESIAETKEQFKSEINDFKLIKSRLEQRMIERFEEEFKKELAPRFDRLEKHVKGFEALAEKVEVISQRVVSLSSEIQKFLEISREIKKADFELVKHAKQVGNMSNEKIELLRKIDMLERLISKMRRNQQ